MLSHSGKAETSAKAKQRQLLHLCPLLLEEMFLLNLLI